MIYAPHECKYVALSYVWGARSKRRLVLASENEESLMECCALAALGARTSIPSTILDTMLVVRQLGERYL